MVNKKSPTKQRIPVDWELVDKYLIGGAKGSQVAAAIGVHYDTLSNRCKEDHNVLFSEYSAKKKQKGNLMLHAKQYQVAMSGNTTMLVWLGKQRLGQTDQPKESQEFNGSLASLLDVMHLIKSSEDFDALVGLARKNADKKDEVKPEGIKC